MILIYVNDAVAAELYICMLQTTDFVIFLPEYCIMKTKNNESEITTFKFHLFVLSSNDWIVWLIAIDLR